MSRQAFVGIFAALGGVGGLMTTFVNKKKEIKMNKKCLIAAFAATMAMGAGTVEAQQGWHPLVQEEFAVSAYCGNADDLVTFLVKGGFQFEFESSDGKKMVRPSFSISLFGSKHEVLAFQDGTKYCLVGNGSFISEENYRGTFKSGE